jgi:hypothetical protein
MSVGNLLLQFSNWEEKPASKASQSNQDSQSYRSKDPEEKGTHCAPPASLDTG